MLQYYYDLFNMGKMLTLCTCTCTALSYFQLLYQITIIDVFCVYISYCLIVIRGSRKTELSDMQLMKLFSLSSIITDIHVHSKLLNNLNISILNKLYLMINHDWL